MRRRTFATWVLSQAVAATAVRAWAGAQDPPADAPQAEPLPGPPPLEKKSLLPPLSTVPVPRGAPAFNVKSVDASLLPRDKQGIWVLDFAFKPLRMISVEVPGKGRRQVHYLAYRIVNRTGAPRDLVPQFIMTTDTGKRYEESVIPNAVRIIQRREDPTIPMLGAVENAGVIPPSTKPGVDAAVYGVAIWDGVDPAADRLNIYVRGLSDGYVEAPATGGGKPTAKYKTLRIDLIRRGDDRDLNEKEIELAEPPYEWVYW